MTTQKGFKTLVRARMAKTGERYAAARRALMTDGVSGTPDPSPTRIAGLNPNSAALARALADAGVVSPLNGRPLSEAMILGIAGGLGAGYILWEFKARGGAILTLGFTNQWQYPGIPGWYGNALGRLGIAAELHETAGAVGAQASLDAALDPRAHGDRVRGPAVDGDVGAAGLALRVLRLPRRDRRADRGWQLSRGRPRPRAARGGSRHDGARPCPDRLVEAPPDRADARPGRRSRRTDSVRPSTMASPTRSTTCAPRRTRSRCRHGASGPGS